MSGQENSSQVSSKRQPPTPELGRSRRPVIAHVPQEIDFQISPIKHLLANVLQNNTCREVKGASQVDKLELPSSCEESDCTGCSGAVLQVRQGGGTSMSPCNAQSLVVGCPENSHDLELGGLLWLGAWPGKGFSCQHSQWLGQQVLVPEGDPAACQCPLYGCLRLHLPMYHPCPSVLTWLFCVHSNYLMRLLPSPSTDVWDRSRICDSSDLRFPIYLGIFLPHQPLPTFWYLVPHPPLSTVHSTNPLINSPIHGFWGPDKSFHFF